MIPPEEPKAQPLPVLGRRWARQGLREPREVARRVTFLRRVNGGRGQVLLRDSPQRQVPQRDTGSPW